MRKNPPVAAGRVECESSQLIHFVQIVHDQPTVDHRGGYRYMTMINAISEFQKMVIIFFSKVEPPVQNIIDILFLLTKALTNN
jgi:hypothetical protein